VIAADRDRSGREGDDLAARARNRFALPIRQADGRVSRYGLPGYAVGVGAKGCVTFSPERIVDYETFKAHQDVEVTELAWIYNMNRGIFMTPGREEEWTLSVAHTEEDVDAYVAVFEEMAAELVG
jgi:glutamate-1-semialdehyde 2,1-aminomutase